jgi:hypothetical protein
MHRSVLYRLEKRVFSLSVQFVLGSYLLVLLEDSLGSRQLHNLTTYFLLFQNLNILKEPLLIDIVSFVVPTLVPHVTMSLNRSKNTNFLLSSSSFSIFWL